MKDQRKNRKKFNTFFILYISCCVFIVIFAYLHLSKIARDYNTKHMELITGLYAEKMNDVVEYLQNYAKEDAKLIEALDHMEPQKILEHLEKSLDRKIFTNIGLVLSNDEIIGSECGILDIKKKKLDQMTIRSETSFISEPYQSSETGTMIMTIFIPVRNSVQIKRLYVSILMENLRQLAVSELLQGKAEVHLLKADSENYITCISSISNQAGNWNNLLLQQKYFQYYNGYSYNKWIKDMRSGKKSGNLSAKIRDKDYTISYQSISSMPGWYVVVELANKNIADVKKQFSAWGGVYGGILVGITVLYMLVIVIMEKRDKRHYMGLSTTDTLTGILNRRAFQRTVEEEISKKEAGIFIFIDIDDFKNYNDVYGHQNGDACLIHFSKAMKQCFPQKAILGRYGGDEFVVYLKNTSVEDAKQYMKLFQKKISSLTLPTGEKVKMSASSGGAVFPMQGEDYVSLLRSADIALYDVKRNGKSGFRI